MMPRIRVLALALLAMTGTAMAQDYPARDLSFIVPYGPGGSTDPISRQFAGQMEKELGRNITLQNKPGAAGALGVALCAGELPRTRRSSSNSAPASCGRSTALLERQRSTSAASAGGVLGAISASGGCGAVQACTTMALAVSPKKGVRPLSAS